jgi:hypothetical protein
VAVPNWLRRAPEQPDEFEARVQDIVRLHGPVGALERDAACRTAGRVLVHGITEANNREAAGTPPIDAAESSRFRRSLARSITSVVEQVRAHRVSAVDLVAMLIVDTCFGAQWERPYLDTDEIPWLVGTAYGVAMELRMHDPELAKQLVPNAARGAAADPTDRLSPLEEDLTRRLIEYGRTSDERMVDELTPIYLRAIEELPQKRRVQLLLFIIERVEQRQLSGNALMPFIFRDTDAQVVSTAALHAAGVYPGTDTDPMSGVRELAGCARGSARDGDESRAAAIFAGLALLGDRRVLTCMGPCWRILSTDGRHLLAQHIRGRTYAGVVDWLVSWLEECEGSEFGAVAAALASIPTIPQAEVVDVRRAIPVWSADDGNVITVVSRWSLDAYGERLRPRLLQIAADEQAPRIMYDVLGEWRISHTQRHLAGVAMRARGTFDSPRPLLPLLASRSSARSDLTLAFVPLEDGDFLAREGQILLCWAIFNPNGPTWMCLGLMPTEEPATNCVFYRVLHPFAQQSGIVGVVQGDDCSSGAVIGRLVEELFRSETLTTTTGDCVYLIGGGVPDVLHVMWHDDAFDQSVRRAMLASPKMRELDVVRAIREIREFNGRPWDRASAQREEAFSRMTPEGLVPPREREGETTDAVIDEWMELVTDREHWVGELINFPGAWHGAIDHTAAALAQTAFTFWQLDDFLARYGYSAFREIAALTARAQQAASDSADGAARDDQSGADRQLTDSDEDEPSYRAAYDAFRQWVGARIDSESKTDLAYAIGGGVVGPQLTAAEELFEDGGKGSDALRRLMRKPWALGYLRGVALGAVGRCELSRDSHDANAVAAEIHRLGLGRVASEDVVHLSNSASKKSEFREGLLCGGRDILAFGDGEEQARALFDWIDEQAGN